MAVTGGRGGQTQQRRDEKTSAMLSEHGIGEKIPRLRNPDLGNPVDANGRLSSLQQRKVYKRQSITPCQEVIAVDMDRRDWAALQERHYTGLLAKGRTSHLPATTSTPLGYLHNMNDPFPLRDETAAFRRLDFLRERVRCLLAMVERRSGILESDCDTCGRLYSAFQAMRHAMNDTHGWQNLHSDDQILISRAERVLRTHPLF